MTINQTARAAITLALALCCSAGAARADEPDAQTPEWAALKAADFPIKFNGYFWTDTGYLSRTAAQSGAFDQQAAYLQGRIVLGASYARGFGGLYALAHVEYLGLVNEFAGSKYEPHTLDAYLKVGTRSWDVQLGRFLGTEVYYRGQGIELYTAEEAGNKDAPTLYLLDYTRGLIDEPGQAAVHWFPTDWLTFELAGEYGQHADQNNYYGIRPVVDARYGGFQVVAGAEMQQLVPQHSNEKNSQTWKGYAARVQYSQPLFTVGLDGSRTSIEATLIDGTTVDTGLTLDKYSFGGWADLNLSKFSLGVGLHRTRQTNQRNENNNQVQGFVSLLYHLPIEGLSMKAVYGLARAHFEDVGSRTQWENYMNSVRVRVLYEFR